MAVETPTSASKSAVPFSASLKSISQDSKSFSQTRNIPIEKTPPAKAHTSAGRVTDDSPTSILACIDFPSRMENESKSVIVVIKAPYSREEFLSPYGSRKPAAFPATIFPELHSQPLRALRAMMSEPGKSYTKRNAKPRKISGSRASLKKRS